MTGLKADMNYDMKWNDIELETGETYVDKTTMKKWLEKCWT